MTVDVEEGGPYAPEAMTLFDYRTDHLDPADVADAEERPSFVYVMPGELQPNGAPAHRVLKSPNTPLTLPQSL